MSSQKGPKHIYAKNINSITIIITLEDTEKIKTEEKKEKRQQSGLNNIYSHFSVPNSAF